MNTISILITLNQQYLPPFQVFLTSLRFNNPGEHFSLYLMHSGIPESALSKTRTACEQYGYAFTSIAVREELFRGAPITQQYPKEMYYRLLAPHLLPRELNRILYLDPDILVLNPIRPLWDIELKGNLFAAAAHTGKTEFANRINSLRFNSNNKYYNSGVLLIDLAAGRKSIQPQEFFTYVNEHANELILPDQDLLNALYGDLILPLDDGIWNYDARNYSNYLLRSAGERNIPWVMEHTAILHFCGKSKPWKKGYPYRFGVLYQHYMQLTRRALGKTEL